MKTSLTQCFHYITGWGLALLYILCTPIIVLFSIGGILLMAANGSLLSDLAADADEDNL